LEGDASKVGGFSLHAGVAAEAHEGQKLERLCRYIARPAISEKRLSLSPQGRVRYQLKTPWKNGTTHVAFDEESTGANCDHRWADYIPTTSVDQVAATLARWMGVTDSAALNSIFPLLTNFSGNHLGFMR